MWSCKSFSTATTVTTNYHFPQPAFRCHSPQVTRQRLQRDPPVSLCPLHVEVGAEGLVPGHHIRPVFCVVVGVDDGERGVMHVSELRAASEIDEIEFHRLAVRRGPCRHAWPVSRIAIMGQEQTIAIQVEHGKGMFVRPIVWLVRLMYLMH